jgi:hypothetical protein
MRSADAELNQFSLDVTKGRTAGTWKWENLQRLGVTLTEDPAAALDFFLDGVPPRADFPLDRQWISAMNKLANEVNGQVQAWRRAGGTPSLGFCRARTELITPFPNCPGLAAQFQIDYVEQLECPDLPPTELEVFGGDVSLLLRNVNTRAGLAKGRRCVAREMGHLTLVVSFGPEDEYTFGPIRMEKQLNGAEFVRWQVPFRLMYAGTVHRSQGMTLDRAVMDCRTQFWEHGQLYVALSRVRSPRGLCVLLRPGLVQEGIAGPVDEGVVESVESMDLAQAAAEEEVPLDFGDMEESVSDAPRAGPLPAGEVSSDGELGVEADEDGPPDDVQLLSDDDLLGE